MCFRRLTCIACSSQEFTRGMAVGPPRSRGAGGEEDGRARQKNKHSVRIIVSLFPCLALSPCDLYGPELTPLPSFHLPACSRNDPDLTKSCLHLFVRTDSMAQHLSAFSSLSASAASNETVSGQIVHHKLTPVGTPRHWRRVLWG
ncbi:unnamed protein product [Musa hybrid cultivar]